MRHSSSLGVGLGLLVMLPALGSSQNAGGTDGGLDNSLAKALDQTVRALAVLTGLEKEIPQRPAVEAVEIARSVTERPYGDEQQRDETLTRLRKDVGRLQMTYDDLEARAHAPSSEPAPTFATFTPARPVQDAGVSTGMNDELRAQLSSEPLLTPIRATNTNLAAGETPANTPTTPDAIADELRRGQALYRAGHYKEALTVLRTLSADVRARYWSARTLERLERFEEALELYQQVAADKTSGYLAERAKGDAEFLAWKQGFEKKLDPQPAAGTRKAAGATSKKPATDVKPASAPNTKPAGDVKPVPQPAPQAPHSTPHSSGGSR
jgi:tetratricopeptide (TPR) repeat protein